LGQCLMAKAWFVAFKERHNLPKASGQSTGSNPKIQRIFDRLLMA